MAAQALKVLIIGGYGTFGGRLARLLADEPELTLLIAGRSRAKAQAFCGNLRGQARCAALAFDREGDVARQIAEAAPDIVVDASGPFQRYGTAPYRVIEAAIAAGAHYLDLADSSAFVAGIGRHDAAARARGVFALTGVSTCPLLTAAVVRELSRGMAAVDSVSAGIAPSPSTGVGLSVLRAIASYAGKPIETLREGHACKGAALIESRHIVIAPPAAVPLGPIRFSLVDVPDYATLPALWPGLRTIWFGAGPRPAVWHRALSLLAWSVRLGLVRSLAPLAPLMHWVTSRCAWGEPRGGMFVAVEGSGEGGAQLSRSWHLIAEGDDGAFIPAMGAEAVIRRCLAGRPPPPGARTAVTDIALADYEASFARRRILSGVREEILGVPLYRDLLGPAWEELPAPIRIMHDLTGDLTADGTATITRGSNPFARLIGQIVGFPRAGTDVPVSVSFHIENGREHWRRTFAGRSFTSTQEAGRGRFAHLLVERFGPLAFGMALVLDGDILRLVIRRWTFFGLPMPRRLLPKIHAFEAVEDGRFRFHVKIGLPLVGPVVAYRGHLRPRAGSEPRRDTMSYPATTS